MPVIKQKKDPGLFISLFTLAFLLLSLVTTVLLFGDEATGGPAQASLILAGTLASVISLYHGMPWQELESSILKSMADVMQPIIILLLIGALIGVWILSGIVPAIIIWGLKLLKPSLFLFAACIISAIVSLATGSSWSTAGTIGIALVGIGNATGINPGLTAGAVISGAYFGDKLSPFSETTNLASSMTGTDLFVHIRHMLYTTIPAMVISLTAYFIIGQTYILESYNPARITAIVSAINGHFDTSLYLLIPPVITIIIMTRKVPAIPAIIIGILLGIIFAVIFQPGQIISISGSAAPSYFIASLKSSLITASKGFTIKSGLKEVDDLLNKGGMSSMLNTIWLIISAMFFAGVMEGSGMLHRISSAILSGIHRKGNLVAATILTNIMTNIIAAEQYLSIVITGRMYKEAYKDMNLKAKNLSRILEDSGTLTSPLVPWNTCGAFMASTLGVATLTYIPFAFLNILTPLISMFYGYTGWTIEELQENEQEKAEKIK